MRGTFLGFSCPVCLGQLKLFPGGADRPGEATMRRRLPAILLVLLLSGCGGRAPDQPQPAGFVNQTRHSDAALWGLWQEAQQQVAQSIDLNPLQRDVAPRILPGDPRALSVTPSQLPVTPEPDTSAQVLLAATGLERSDPTGLIPCPQPCDARYATAYSRYQPELVHYAASWESRESDFRTLLEYEFENQILFALGYDTRWR